MGNKKNKQRRKEIERKTQQTSQALTSNKGARMSENVELTQEQRELRTKKTETTEVKKSTTSYAGHVLEALGDVSVFTGIVGVSIYALAFATGYLGVWAIALMLLVGIIFRMGGDYLIRRKAGKQDTFSAVKSAFRGLAPAAA